MNKINLLLLRMIAGAIDAILLGWSFGFSIQAAQLFTTSGAGIIIMFGIWMLLFAAHSAFVMMTGKTVGKFIAGLQVYSKDGSKVDGAVVIIRSIVVVFLGSLTSYLENLIALFNSKSRTGHDLILGTYVSNDAPITLRTWVKSILSFVGIFGGAVGIAMLMKLMDRA